MATPTLLTPQEAATVARCSVKTVRRAYRSGLLEAHRRRGSRAVLLEDSAVVAWAKAEKIHATGVTGATVLVPALPAAGQATGATSKSARRAPRLGTPERFDLSAAALSARRAEAVAQ